MKSNPGEIGYHYGKHDLDRYGYFAEMGYLHGRGYVPPITMPNIRDPKNRQMLPQYPKTKVMGLQDCYFETVFRRIFIGEAYFEPIGYALKKRNESNKLNRGIFRPASYTHLHATPGDFFGCFIKTMKAFDPRIRPIPNLPLDKNAMKKFVNFIPSSPGKKGGYGYKDITINPYPKYISTPYYSKTDIHKGGANKVVQWAEPSPGRLFQERYAADKVTYKPLVPGVWSLFGVFKPSGPTKSLGGCMDGCFDKWPKHSFDPYIEPWKIERSQGRGAKSTKGQEKGANKEREPIWSPNGKGKTNPAPSVLEYKANIATNFVTWKNMKPVTYTREFFI